MDNLKLSSLNYCIIALFTHHTKCYKFNALSRKWYINASFKAKKILSVSLENSRKNSSAIVEYNWSLVKIIKKNRLAK